MKSPLLVAAFALLMTSWASAVNLVRNGGFEDGMTAWQWVETDKADATCKFVADVVHSGNGAIRITNKSKYPVYKRLIQPVPLKPNAAYRLTAWSKGKDMGWWGVRVGAARSGDWNRLTYLPSGHSGDRDYDWQQTVYEFTTDDKTVWALQVQINDRIGEVWLDDIQLEEVIEGKSAAPEEAQLFTPTVLDNLNDAGFYPALHEDLGKTAPTLHVKPKYAGNPDFGFSITWSDKGLRFAIDVIDEMPGSTVKGANMWKGDAVQIALDTRPDVRRRKLDEHFYEVGCSAGATGEVGRWSWRLAGAATQNTLDWSGAIETAEVTRDGWTIEALLPWQAIGLAADGLPKWIANENPGFLIKDLPSGFIKFFISHPAAKEYAKTFTSTLAQKAKGRPGVFGICLENEPSYFVGGHDPDSRPLYTAFLRQRHGTIDVLNKLYGTTHKDFASIDPPLPLGYRQPHVEFTPKEGQQGGGSADEGSYRPDGAGESRWYFDWCEFNTDYHMDWVEWLNGLVKAAAPDVPTHIKICEPLTRQRTLWGGRDDFERPTMLTDIAGNDSGSAYGDNELGFPAGYAYAKELKSLSLAPMEYVLLSVS